MNALLSVLLVVLLLTVPAAASPVPDEEAPEDRESSFRHTWTDEELPLEVLTMDPGRRPGIVSASEAAADVDRLFYLLAHGYSGYAYFDEGGRFDRARTEILGELATQPEWKPRAFAELIRRHLGFVRDCHTSVGGVSYGEHLDWWFDTGFEVRQVDGRFEIDVDGAAHGLISVDGRPPAESLKRSLNERGEAVRRIGVLARGEPDPMAVEVRGETGTRTIRVPLGRSSYRYYSRRKFREDRVGGIPVLRIRTFSDHHAEALREFVASAERMRGESCVIVDVRGNGGGNERWVSAWVRGLTGGTPWSPFVFSELVSRTTMAGRANYQAWLFHHNPGTEFYEREARQFLGMAGRIGPDGIEPCWTPLTHPDNPVIPNKTTIVIVTNGLVASAGEGFVLRASQAANVVVVGENTHGALTFGNVSAHQLPNSGLAVRLPINFGFFPDGVFREESGLAPDWWVPAADAVNFAAAALRAGTIPTVRPLTARQREADLVPEGPGVWKGPPRWVVVLSLIGLSVTFSGFVLRRVRRRKR